jgi:putative membrane protein
MTIPSPLLLSAICAAAMLAHAPASAQSGATSSTTMQPADASPPAGDRMQARGTLDSADRGMLRDIAEANLAEVSSGQLALQKAQSPEVKQFARMMVDDHSKALKDIRQLAHEKNLPDMPTGPGLKHQAVMAELKAVEGSTFDQKYMAHAGLDDHKATLALLQKTQSKAKDADLKALAAKMTPVVQAHLKHAQEVARM